MAARIGAFLLLCFVCLGGAATYLFLRAAQLKVLDAPREPAASHDRVLAILARPHVVFLDTPDYGHRHLAVAPLDELSDRAVTDTTCARVYAVARVSPSRSIAGRGAAHKKELILCKGLVYSAPRSCWLSSRHRRRKRATSRSSTT